MFEKNYSKSAETELSPLPKKLHCMSEATFWG